MSKLPTPSIKFKYAIPASIVLTMPLLRKTLREVQAQLLTRQINGGSKQLTMETTTTSHSCGMAACPSAAPVPRLPRHRELRRAQCGCDGDQALSRRQGAVATWRDAQRHVVHQAGVSQAQISRSRPAPCDREGAVASSLLDIRASARSKN